MPLDHWEIIKPRSLESIKKSSHNHSSKLRKSGYQWRTKTIWGPLMIFRNKDVSICLHVLFGIPSDPPKSFESLYKPSNNRSSRLCKSEDQGRKQIIWEPFVLPRNQHVSVCLHVLLGMPLSSLHALSPFVNHQTTIQAICGTFLEIFGVPVHS